jgi:hypothetical protein
VLASLGASARALQTEVRVRQDQDRVFRKLLDVRFSWAAPDRRCVHPDLARRLADSRHATPMLADFVIEQIAGIAAKAPSDRKPNPLGLLIAGFGAKSDGGEPWPVPLRYMTDWNKREEGLDRIREKQAQLDAIRRSQGISTSGVSRA